MARIPRIGILGALVLGLTAIASRPASGQVDFSGEWAARIHEDEPHRQAGPNAAPDGRLHGAEIGDYTGLPLNAAARLRADSWDASIQTLKEHQAQPGGSAYAVVGIANLRISKVVDEASQQLIAFKIFRSPGGTTGTRMIWMDGRPHPPAYGVHTFEGFSTGTWSGGALTVETTHLKAGYLQLNGVPHSDKATITEHYFRHGDYLTVVSVVDDPQYLEEPLIRSSNWVLDVTQQLIAVPFEVVDEIAGQPEGRVPHHLPGTNSSLHEFSERHDIPFEATRGGRETLYPEYQITLKALRTKP
jgi:hypothetical protein